MTVKTVGYLRVSKADQAKDEKSSLRDQKAAIETKATVGLWFEDRGASAYQDEERPEFEKLVEYCKANPTKGGEVWAYDTSRFSRKNWKETGHFFWTLETCGWNLRFAEGDDVQDEMSRDMNISMQVNTNHNDSRIKSKKVKAGQRGTAEQGFCIGKPPYGYGRMVFKNGEPTGTILQHGDRKPPGTQTKYWPEDGPEQANVVWLYERYATGRYSTYQLADELRDPEEWTNDRVGRILQNVAYTGTYVACHGEVDLPDNHTPLVSRELWLRVQAVSYNNSCQKRGVAGDYLLSGLLQCSECGGNLVCVGGAKATKQYGCTVNRRRDGKCANSTTFTTNKLDPLVIDAVAKVLSDADTHEVIEAEVDRVYNMSTASVSERRKRLTRRRNKLGSHRNNIMRRIKNDVITDEEAKATLQPIRDDLADINSQLQELRFEERQPKADTERKELIQAAKDFKTVIAQVPTVEAKELLRPWLEKGVVTVNPRGVTLHIRRVPETLKVLTGSRRSKRPSSGSAKRSINVSISESAQCPAQESTCEAATQPADFGANPPTE